MAETLELAKAEHEWTPATWTEWHGRILVMCPRCGESATLVGGSDDVDEFEVSDEGVVTPEMTCVEGTFCGFSFSGKLLDWERRE